MKRGFLLGARDKELRKIGSVTHDKKSEPNVDVPKLGDYLAHTGHLATDATNGLETDLITPGKATWLSFGKLSEKEKALPEDYEDFLAAPTYLLLGPSSNPADYDLKFVTVPQNADGDGQSQWIVNGDRRMNQVLRAPGYPKRLPKTRQPVMVTVKKTTDMGSGLFAACDVPRGELIFAERPLLVAPRGFSTPRIPHYTGEQRRQLGMMKIESELKVALDRMSLENQKTFTSLMNSHTEDGSGPILGIIRTNGYDVGALSDGNNTEENHNSGVGALGSRINHSCRPNVMQSFELESFSLQFHAARDIKAGDQLFYAYCDLHNTAAQRRVQLAPYGVVCKCLSCLNATPESDKVHQLFDQLIPKLQTRGMECWGKGQRTARQIHDAMLRMEKDMIDEGLECQARFDILLGNIALSYGSMRRHKERDAYLKRCRVGKEFLAIFAVFGL